MSLRLDDEAKLDCPRLRPLVRCLSLDAHLFLPTLARLYLNMAQKAFSSSSNAKRSEPCVFAHFMVRRCMPSAARLTEQTW